MSTQPVNHLIKESSPYLIQHAHNPVDWYPWCNEALEKAKKENKPILLSIGYATCHWCHVMEKESFEDHAVAEIMNRYFVNIKVDREERPDIDMTYMEAAQLMTGQGGWPLHCFLTPDLHPFYAGTYFPPEPGFNRPAWTQVISSVAKAWVESQQSLMEHGLRVSERIVNMDSDLLKHARAEFQDTDTHEIAEGLITLLDFSKGGVKGAPKFPTFPLVDFCLHAGYILQNEKLLEHASISLLSMHKGGIYDPIDGGLYRYSVDDNWQVPHFEKMLYDNAALLHSLANAYRIDRNAEWKIMGEDVCRFLDSKLKSVNGGYFSGIDADSEGEEGKYYAWEKDEAFAIAGEQANLLEHIFYWPETGIFEGKHLLIRKDSWESLAEKAGKDFDVFLREWHFVRNALRKKRMERIPPIRDEKLITAWNALAVKGFASFGGATNNETYINEAERLLAFILIELRENGKLMRTKTNGVFGSIAFLEDYAYLLDAILELASVRASDALYEQAKSIFQELVQLFERDKIGMFKFVQRSASEPIPEKNALFDLPLPSANAIIANAMLKLGTKFEEHHWAESAHEMLATIKPAIKKYPGSMVSWAKLNLYQAKGIAEFLITGSEPEHMINKLNATFTGESIVQISESGQKFASMKKAGSSLNETQLFMCKNYVCKNSVSLKDITLDSAIKQHLLD